jgi:hypothetical protein
VTKDTFYNEGSGEKGSFAQLNTKADSSYPGSDGVLVPKVDPYVLQASGKDADAAYKVLGDDSIKDGTLLFIQATVHGGRLRLISANKSKFQGDAAAPAEGDEQEEAAPAAAAPKKPAFGTTKKTVAPAAEPEADEEPDTAAPKKPAFGLKKPGAAAPKKSPWTK